MTVPTVPLPLRLAGGVGAVRDAAQDDIADDGGIHLQVAGLDGGRAAVSVGAGAGEDHAAGADLGDAEAAADDAGEAELAGGGDVDGAGSGQVCGACPAIDAADVAQDAEVARGDALAVEDDGLGDGDAGEVGRIAVDLDGLRQW